MFYRFAGVFACGLISACGLMLAGCSHGSLSGSKAAPFVGKWVATRTVPSSTIQGKETFDFQPDGKGSMTLDYTIDRTTEPFQWHQDDHAVNVAYAAQSDHPAQTDRLVWSLADDGSELTLTGGSGPTVFEKSP